MNFMEGATQGRDSIDSGVTINAAHSAGSSRLTLTAKSANGHMENGLPSRNEVSGDVDELFESVLPRLLERVVDSYTGKQR